MLTPLDIETREFKRKPYGYSIEEVDKFLIEVINCYERLYKENIELKDKISILNDGISHYKSLEETLQSTLMLAEKTAEETKSAAYQKGEQIINAAEIKANQILEQAKQEVFKIKQEIERLKKQYVAAKIQMMQILNSQLQLLEQSSLFEEEESDNNQLVKRKDDKLNSDEGKETNQYKDIDISKGLKKFDEDNEDMESDQGEAGLMFDDYEDYKELNQQFRLARRDEDAI